MTDDSPYTKRETDEWRNIVMSSLERIESEMTRKGDQYEKTVKELAKLSSNNAGQIYVLQENAKTDREALKLIKDIKTFAGVVKWLVYTIVVAGALYSAVKLIASGILIRLLSH